MSIPQQGIYLLVSSDKQLFTLDKNPVPTVKSPHFDDGLSIDLERSCFIPCCSIVENKIYGLLNTVFGLNYLKNREAYNWFEIRFIEVINDLLKDYNHAPVVGLQTSEGGEFSNLSDEELKSHNLQTINELIKCIVEMRPKRVFDANKSLKGLGLPAHSYGIGFTSEEAGKVLELAEKSILKSKNANIHFELDTYQSSIQNFVIVTCQPIGKDFYDKPIQVLCEFLKHRSEAY